MRFDVPAQDEIAEGSVTDAYFPRTERILREEGVNPRVVADVGEDLDEWHVLAGLKDAAHLLEGRPVDLYAPPEGTLFREKPVARIEGRYLDFCRFETAVLGFLCQSSGVASASMRCRAAAGDREVLSFGTRRVHPSTAASIERSAYIGGCDGVSNTAAGRIGLEARGTMPHALVIAMGGQEEAWRAYDGGLPEGVPRVMLCDTYSDEKEEAIRAAEALGDALDAVRLDTTSTRRGDMRGICEEVRWELDARGYGHVGLFVSGGVGSAEILELKHVVDGFGVGGSIASADPVDLSLDIVEVEGKYAAKRGEKSGRKNVYRRDMQDTVALEEGGGNVEGEPLLRPVLKGGEIVTDFDIHEARERCLGQVEKLKDKGELGVGLE